MDTRTLKLELIKQPADCLLPAGCFLAGLAKPPADCARGLFPLPSFLLFVVTTATWNGKTRHVVLQSVGVDTLPAGFHLTGITCHAHDAGLQVEVVKFDAASSS